MLHLLIPFRLIITNKFEISRYQGKALSSEWPVATHVWTLYNYLIPLAKYVQGESIEFSPSLQQWFVVEDRGGSSQSLAWLSLA